jgi:fatty acid desaturase
MGLHMSNASRLLPYKTEFEMPTWLLIAATYGAWLILMMFYSNLTSVFWLMLMMLVLALFGSVCHELLHGHPSNKQKLNDAIGTPPLSLYPYFDYKRTHLKHHNEDDLTKPGIDPESFFIRTQDWVQMSAWQQKLAWVNMTLAGRLLLGPARSYLALIGRCRAEFRNGNTHITRQWLAYIVSTILVLCLVVFIFKIPIAIYLLAVYLGHALIALRSFYEHQTHSEPKHRSVIIPSIKSLSFLYLYNNLHVVHHKHPGLAWYLISAEFQRNQQSYHQSNGGFSYQGYHEWLKFLFQPVASPIFPESGQ